MTTKIIPILGLAILFLFAGCVQSPGNGGNPLPPGNGAPNPPSSGGMGWMAYVPVQAPTNPWQVNTSIPPGTVINSVNAPTEDQLVNAWLGTQGVSTDGEGFIPHDEDVCQALNCPRGDYLVVHPTDEASASKLVTLGFTSYDQPFTLAEIAPAGSVYITLVNASGDTLYYGGCNDFIPEKETNGAYLPLPPKICVWEGLPSALIAGQKTSFTWNPEANGNYRVSVGYGLNCEAGKPLSQASCVGSGTLYTKTFDVTRISPTAFVKMSYAEKQCGNNPWQADQNVPIGTPQSDVKTRFVEWAKSEGLHPTQTSVNYPSPDTATCAACGCPTGTTFDMVIPGNEQSLAEGLGFTYEGGFTPSAIAPDYAGATWYVYTPFQCFANFWNSTKDPVHSVEKDIGKLVEYLEGKGIKVQYTAFIRGISLSQECLKRSSDRYGIGITDPDSNAIITQTGVVKAGKIQTQLFTSQDDTTPTKLVYRTKFCAAPPWGTPDLSIGHEAEVSARVAQWLSEQGIPSLGVPTIHNLPPSATGTCDTDSGSGVMVTVPAWSAVHLGAKGFLKPNTLFNPFKTQVYPALSASGTNADPIIEAQVSDTNGSVYTLTLTNPAGNASLLYYSGCNPFVPEKGTNGVYAPKPAKNCAEEPAALTVNVGESKSFIWMPSEDGVFRIRVDFGYDCLAESPLNAGACGTKGHAYSDTLAVDVNESPSP